MTTTGAAGESGRENQRSVREGTCSGSGFVITHLHGRHSYLGRLPIRLRPHRQHIRAVRYSVANKVFNTIR
ncbi:hypothetical protein GCM10023224_32380 [Streptomonospora halophila]|uniref:Uncharacterized protein n=1 Tax=Streptomonospora halophila TaxID=427369 RepID=A0ABP9GSD9_9ACTN